MKFKFLLLLVCSVLLWSCSSSDSSDTNTATDSKQIEDEVSEVDETQPQEPGDDGEDFPAFVLPSSFHISSLLQRAGLDFDEGVCNNPSNVNLYSTQSIKLLNFGVYSSDLFFNVLKDQNDQSKQYVKCLKQISEETGMGTIFNSNDILERFEQNIDNKDSVLFLVLEVEEQTDMYVERTNEEHTAMVIFTGAWLEGMYLGLLSYDDSKNEELARRLFEQACLLDNIVAGMQIHPGDDPIIMKVTAELEAIFNTVSSTDAYQKGDFGLVESEVPIAAISTLTKQIGQLRSNITKNNL
jgi:hypothetical protein